MRVARVAAVLVSARAGALLLTGLLGLLASGCGATSAAGTGSSQLP